MSEQTHPRLPFTDGVQQEAAGLPPQADEQPQATGPSDEPPFDFLTDEAEFPPRADAPDPDSIGPLGRRAPSPGERRAVPREGRQSAPASTRATRPDAPSASLLPPRPSAALDVDGPPEAGGRTPAVWSVDDADSSLDRLGDRIAAITGQPSDLSIHPPPSLPPPEVTPPVGLPSRYTWLGPLGEGGQGSVELVHDHDLGRPLALKTLLPHKRSGDHLLDLYREARVTGQLDHPQIIRIYDVGQLPDGRLYYTMPRMPGASLHDILVRLRRGDAETQRRWDLPALLLALEKACTGVGYAHSKGVIHRDLKPANILLGNHGEVLVVDWGIARLEESSSWQDGEPARLWSQTGEVRKERVRGSPPYMAPEQIQHPNQVTPAADVFCLGVILYEALTGLNPFPGKDVDTIVRGICHGKPVPPRERAPHRAIPAELEEICLRALEKFPGHRYGSASELASDIATYLAGGHRKARAERRVKEARSMQERLRGLQARKKEAEAELRAEDGPRLNVATAPELRAKLQDRVQSLQRAIDGVMTEAIWSLQRGLADDPENRELLGLYSKFFAERYEDAEVRDADREKLVHRALFSALDQGDWKAWVGAGAELAVETLPMARPIELLRVEERAGRFRPTESLGLVPDRTCLSLAPGRYALCPALESGETESLSIPRPWIYPILLGRGERTTIRLDLRGANDLGGAFAFIPGGPALLGGDEAASGAGPLRRVNLPAFAIARQPVTVGAYARFLAAVRKDSLAREKQLRPGDFEAQLKQGAKLPVTGIDLSRAKAYCDWLRAATGKPIRLPRADEWEKSFRAADARTYPWGSRWSPERCASVITCQPGDPLPSVGHFEDDCSPFGVRDGAGGVWEWTADTLGTDGIVVGGSVVSEAGGCRLAGRRALRTSTQLSFLGFRVVLELPSSS